MRRSRAWVAAIGVAALAAGVLAVAAPAGAGNGGEKPWPILRVMKTIGQAEQQAPGALIDVPPDTVFTVKVTCESRNGNMSAQGNGFLETLLTFDSTGAPKSADKGGWTDLGDGYWTFQGYELMYKLCTAVETDITGTPPAGAIETQYKCDALAEQVAIDYTSKDEEVDAANGATFGCVRPLPEGEYQPVADAAVQFTAFWEDEACIEREDSDATTQSMTKCQETGTLTVDNLDPAWVVVASAAVAPAAVQITPTFTG